MDRFRIVRLLRIGTSLENDLPGWHFSNCGQAGELQSSVLQLNQSQKTPNIVQKLIFTSLVLIASTSVVFAQKARKIQFRTLCVEQIENLTTVNIPAPGKNAKPQEISLFADVSPQIEGTFETDDAIFYQEKPGADGKVESVAVGKAKMGKSNRQMFVFAPNEKGGDKLPYQVIAFDDDTKAFAMGQIRAINLASVPVRYLVAGKPLPEIPAGGFSQFPQPSQVDEYNIYPMVVQYRNPDGEWVDGKSSNWKASDRKREIVVTLFAPETKSLTVRNFSDIPPWLQK